MKETKSLFREFLNASGYNDYNNEQAQVETPIKTQLQTLLSNLPDEEQLQSFEGDLRTLKTSSDAMGWESPSMNIEIKKIATDVLTVREKLRNIISTIEQLLRDVNISNYAEEGNNLEKDNLQEDVADYDPTDSVDFDWKDWDGKSKGHHISEFDTDKLIQGAKVEREHAGKMHPKLALRITMDHLIEDPEYYTKLAKMEKKKVSENANVDMVKVIEVAEDVQSWVVNYVRRANLNDDEVAILHDKLKAFFNGMI